MDQNYINGQQYISGANTGISRKNKWAALFLCIFGGFLGLHQFYAGKIGKGILYLFTFGVYGIMWIVDIFRILFNVFPDSDGLPITGRNRNSTPDAQFYTQQQYVPVMRTNQPQPQQAAYNTSGQVYGGVQTAPAAANTSGSLDSLIMMAERALVEQKAKEKEALEQSEKQGNQTDYGSIIRNNIKTVQDYHDKILATVKEAYAVKNYAEVNRCFDKVLETAERLRSSKTNYFFFYIIAVEIAETAYEAGNNTDVDNYCNRILKSDIENYKAWYLKGKAKIGKNPDISAVKSRMEDIDKCFDNALTYARSVDKDNMRYLVDLEYHRLHKLFDEDYISNS